VGVFPEGIGLALGHQREPRAGALLLSALSGAPFVPAALQGTLEAWPPKPQFPRPGSVTVRFGEPFAPWRKGDRPGRDEIRLSVGVLMERIRLLLPREPA